jgi:two-component system osmolarity sensor histidine kinase EnvZ
MRIRVLPGRGRVMKRVLPRSLLGRSLLIILIPLVITLAVAVQIFYGTHLNIVSRRLASAVAGEISATIDALGRATDADDREFQLDRAWDNFDLLSRFRPGARLLPDTASPPSPWDQWLLRPVDDDLAAGLRARVGKPFTLDWEADPNSVVVRVQLADGVLDVWVPRKRLYTGTLPLFLVWLVGTALLLFGLAALFMRNQVRAIRRLAVAAEAFGMGRDVGPIRPEGASEVRQAATAFNRMQERIRRFLTQRTEMLAGVSHDLRTPLTRLRLAFAMFPADVAEACDVAGMTGDLEEMDRMIGGYLAFARGEGAEQATMTDLAAVLGEVAASARRAGSVVRTQAPEGLLLPLRADAFRRALTNIVDNARRHARHVLLSAAPSGARLVQVTVDDDGPGIPADRREGVFRPFAAGTGGGTGLGLTIARDIVRAHGGEILLEDSPLGGLRARIMLPV